MTNAEVSTASEKNKRVILNVMMNLSYQTVVLIFGFLLPRLYLVKFGSEVNGLDNTIKNIFACLALLEAGVGLSAQHALYAPVATGNTEKINGILSASRKFYIKSGMIYTLITVVFAAVYPLIVATTLNYFTIFAVIILYGLPGIINFFLRGKYNALLEVDGKKYIITLLATITLALSNVLRLVFLMLTDNLILIQVTYCIPSIIQIFFIIIYVRKKYNWIDWKARPDLPALSQKKSVLIHQISGCVFSNTDSVIISVMCGMNYASVYAVFSLFFTNLQRLVTSFTDSITFRLGQMFYVDRDKFYRRFSLYESVYYMLLFACYTVAAAFLMPIVRLYTNGVGDAAIYYSKSILLLFAVATVLTGTEAPMHQIVNIAGKYNETRHQAVWEMSINIVISLTAVYKTGIAGCLIGTIAALIYRNNALILFVMKNVMHKSPFPSYKRLIVNMAASLAVILFLGTDGCTAQSYIYVIAKAAINSVWIVMWFAGINFIFDRKNYMSLLRKLKASAKRYGGFGN